MTLQRINLLIMSAGGLVGTYLIRHFKKQPIKNVVLNLIAVDCNADNYSRYIADKFYVVSSILENKLLEDIKEIVDKEEIDIIMPVSSYDIRFFADNENRIKELNVKIILNSSETINVLNNKKRMYEFMKSIDIKVPCIYEEVPLFPAVIKPLESSGSKGFYKLTNLDDYIYWRNKYENNNYIVTEFIRGKEYTVDCLFNEKSELIGYNTRSRIKMISGGVVIAQNEFKSDIYDIITRIVKNIDIKGAVNFQFIEDSSGDKYIIDFNTRLASGGIPLTVESGFDIPSDLIRMLLGIKPLGYKNEKNNLKMYRFYEEYIT